MSTKADEQGEQLEVEGVEAPTNGLWMYPSKARACFVLAHGAGTGMRHAFLDTYAAALVAHGVAVYRFDFPYRAAGRKLPDRAPTLEATVDAALRRAASLAPDLPLFAGGKSMGGRMTVQRLAQVPNPNVRGLIFLGFPLHPPKKPSINRAKPLFECPLPMLFLQGSRDALATPALLQEVLTRLGTQAEPHIIEGADHGFAMLKRGPQLPGGVMAHLAELSVTFMDRHGIGPAKRRRNHG
jgi:predicted alpha/beta-hydrolase family hydrolase